DLVEVVPVDPGTQECGWNRNAHDAFRSLSQLHAPEPAGIDLGSEAGLQLRLDALDPIIHCSGNRQVDFFDQVPRKREVATNLPVDAALHSLPLSYALPPRSQLPAPCRLVLLRQIAAAGQRRLPVVGSCELLVVGPATQG